MMLGCEPSQWSMLMLAKKLLGSAINAIDDAKSNSFDEQLKIFDYSLQKVCKQFRFVSIFSYFRLQFDVFCSVPVDCMWLCIVVCRALCEACGGFCVEVCNVYCALKCNSEYILYSVQQSKYCSVKFIASFKDWNIVRYVQFMMCVQHFFRFFTVIVERSSQGQKRKKQRHLPDIQQQLDENL